MSERIWLSPPHMGDRERELLLEAFDSNWIAPLGPHVNAFEKEFAQAVDMPCAAALSSGTAALHLALQLCGVTVGDEVLTSSFTFAATANAIAYCGASPVFLDSDEATWNMDPGLLEEELAACQRRGGKLPRAVLVVDVNGQCANYSAIEPICQRYGVPLIEDAAEALGARIDDRKAGTFGDVSCFSFNGNKIITTSGGGMLVSRSAELVNKARFLSTQARDPFPHYEHSHIGYNYRMSNLLAAVGRGQLAVLEERVRARRANFAYYQNRFAPIEGIAFMPEPDGYRSTRWLTAITIDEKVTGCNRETVRLALEAQNIESRPIWKPMHQQPVFSAARSRITGVSDRIFRDGLCLPSGSALTDAQRDRIATIVETALRARRPVPAGA